MSRYLIIDTEKEMQAASVVAVELLLRNGAVSEGETLSKFKEVFVAGEKRHRDYNHCTEWGFDCDEKLSWDNFSKTL